MELVKNIFTSGLGMGTGAISDTVKLVVIGGTVETARRVASSSWTTFIDSFFLTAHFTQEDVPYDWIMHWLSKQPAWGRSREFDITTANAPRGGLEESTGDLEDEDEITTLGRKRKLVKFMPAYDTTHTIYYRGHWLRITRSKRSTDYGQCREIKISVVARNNTVIKQLVLEAKKMYEKDAEHRIHVFIPDTWGCWRWNGSRQKRPLDSIVLESSVKDMIVADCKDFMNSEEWYAERGIPYRRGYLLYGVPGSGKTSLIHALAGELGLDIYALSLSAKGMSDNTLTQLMGRIPTRCIVLLEDLDASFTHSTTRDSKSTGVPSAQTATQAAESDGSSLTLSGLLNSIDGVTAPEGRILVATTNHIDRLDEALRRPGRMDVWINFKHATKWQAEGIFKRFFPFVPKAKSGTDTPTDETATDPTITLSTEALKGKSKRTSLTGIPLLEEDELNTLAKKFGDTIPEDEISVAGLQGFLLKNKSRPRECVEEVGKWVIEERERRERLKKEKEERERKEKEEAEKTEKEEKEKKEKEEKEKEKETATTTTTESPVLDVAAARKALRRAKKAALVASPVPSDTGLPTPPAEGTPLVASEKSSSDEATSDDEEEADDDESSTSSTSSSSSEEEKEKKKKKTTKTTKKDKKSGKGKEKWVAVKKAEEDKSEDSVAAAATDSTAAAATDATTTTTAAESAEEDLSSVDALVDAATKSSPAEVAASA